MSPYYQGNIITAINALLPGGIANILNLGLGIGAILALGTMIYGGILYSTAGFNPNNKKEAVAWIIAAVKGLVLIALGFILLQILNPSILNVPEANMARLQQLSNPRMGFTNRSTGSARPANVQYNSSLINTINNHTTRLNELFALAQERRLTNEEEREVDRLDREKTIACDMLCSNHINSRTPMARDIFYNCWQTPAERQATRRRGCSY